MEYKQYLHEHAIPIENAKKYGVQLKSDRISIPVKNIIGETIFYKHRMFTGDAKYRYDKGATSSLFGIHLIPHTNSDDKLLLTEGEFDAMSLWVHRKFALSSTGGSGTFKEEWLDVLSNNDVVILYDNDKAGAEGAYNIFMKHAEGGYKNNILIALPTQGKDISEHLANGGSITDIKVWNLPQMTFEKNTKKERLEKSRELIEFLLSSESSDPLFQEYREVFHKNILSFYRETKAKKKLTKEKRDNVKDIPITNFLEVKSGWAKCIWHDDSNPSMKYNNEKHRSLPNTVKCFSCGKFGTVVDVVMQLENCSTKEAFTKLKQYKNGV